MAERPVKTTTRPETLGMRGARGESNGKKAGRPKSPRQPGRKEWASLAGWQFVFLGLGCMGGLVLSLSRLPDVGSLQNWVPTESTQILDCKGRILANVHGEENRQVIPLSDIPKTLQQAVIAVEDARFYEHHGVNLRGIARAAVADIAEGSKAEGGSTITQQLAKNLFLSHSKSLARKLADAWLAIQLEHRFAKSQILEMYLNQVYWGHNAYGIQAASNTYFGKKTKDLTLAESAQLAFLLRGPERYSPYKNPADAKKGQSVALTRMVKAGFINQKQANDAAAIALKYPGIPNSTYRAPYFTSFLLNQLMNRYGNDAIMRGGLKVHSTLDWDIQQQAESLLKEAVNTHGKTLHFTQGAIVVLDPRTGAIRAMVGGVDYAASKFNRITQAYRQPGSSFKPFVYLTAFAKGLSPGTTMSDEKVSYNAGSGQLWTPENFGGQYFGTMTLRKALERSNNVIAVKVLNRVGVDDVIENAHRLGIQSQLRPNLSIALGSSEVTPLELASAYGVFAANGMRAEPQAYTMVVDRTGMIVERHQPRPRQVFDPAPVKILNDALAGVVLYGTGAAANIGRPAAGKTGTTSDQRDAWFVGYTPDLVGLIWVGNDDNSKMVNGTTGGGVCAPLWKRLMTLALAKVPSTPFAKPESWSAARASRSATASVASGSAEFYVPIDDDEVPLKKGLGVVEPLREQASSSAPEYLEPSLILQDMQ